MSEENQATPPAAPNNDAEVQALKESVQKLEAKNRELIGKMQKKELIEPDDYESLKNLNDRQNKRNLKMLVNMKNQSWQWKSNTEKEVHLINSE